MSKRDMTADEREALERQLQQEIAAGQPMPGTGRTARPFAELRESGLLWLINKVVFHPRGFALALNYQDGELVGWKLLGDGSEPWQFGVNADDEGFAAAEATLQDAGGHR